MRLRNVKDKSVINNSKYMINEPAQYKGCFSSLFNNNNPINIEIGMGKGNFIIGMAINNPNINFIGIEKFDSVMTRALQKIEEKEMPNLRMILMDAMEIDEVFNNEINTIYLNFSDPWPKSRHSKRRLSSDVFLTKYDKVFIGNNDIIMKTDNRSLFEYSLSSISEYGYKFSDVTLDLASVGDKTNVMTEYEEKFSKLGNPIYRLKAYKNKGGN